MNTDKIKELIARQNEQLEQHAADEAARIIQGIASLQQSKMEVDKDIDELRKRLKEIQVTQLDATSILGN